MNEQSHEYWFLLICLCLVAVVIAVYWPVYNYDFVKLDDGSYVTDNIKIQSGLNFKSIYWAFTLSFVGNWHPITMLSYILDYQLFKDQAGGYHLINVLFHILNTLLLFYILMRMTGAVWPSAFVAAAFALHPLHVESVAWIAERKDLLSTFFWLLTMCSYVHYVENPKLKWYLTAILFFILGLMSKPMLVTLPFVLLLLDYWPLERFGRQKLFYLIREKIPFFFLSAISSVITFLVQRSSGAVISFDMVSPKLRVCNAFISYIKYIEKMVWPSQLAIFYSYSGNELSVIRVTICELLLILISICFIYLGRRYRFFAVGWLWYLGTLVPVIGLVQVGSQAMADRYTYITLTGLFIIIAFSAKEFVPKWRYKNFLLAFLAFMVLVSLASVSWRQVRYWKNSITLFEHTLQITKNNYYILHGYAASLFDLDRFDKAIEYYNKSLEIEPDFADAHNGLGLVLQRTGKASEAIEQFKLAVKYKPGFSSACYNLATMLCKRGKYKEAVDYFEQALKHKPDFIKARINLGMAFYELREFDKAIESFNKVIELEAGNIKAHANLGMSLTAKGKIDEAIEETRFVLRAEPNNVQMHLNLGGLLEKKGKIAEAIKSYKAAVKINPYDITAQQFLEAAIKKQGAP